MSELRPEDVFTNIEPGEKFHYLERESVKAHQRMRGNAILFMIILTLLFSPILLMLALGKIDLLRTLKENYFVIFIVIIMFLNVFEFHYRTPKVKLKNSGIGITNGKLIFKSGRTNIKESTLKLSDISDVHTTKMSMMPSSVNIVLTSGEKFSLNCVKNRDRFIKILDSLTGNQSQDFLLKTR